MGSVLRVAWRNVGRNRRRTAIAVGAVVIGIAGTMLSVGLNVGLMQQMVETAIATELGHVQIHAAGWEADAERPPLLADGGRAATEALAGLPEVRAFARRVRGEGLVQSARASAGVRLLGIEPEREPAVSSVAAGVVAGHWIDDTPRRAMIGEALAERLHVAPGDKIVLSAQDSEGELTGEALRVAGLFRTASRDYDTSTVLVPIGDAQRLLGLGDAVSEVVVVARSRGQVAALRDALRARLGASADVASWRELSPILVYLIELMDQMGWFVYGAVFVAMAFGIANVMLMAVYERMRELGVLLAIGTPPWRIVAQIVAESLLVTGLGLALGFALALATVAALGDGLDLSAFAEGLTAYGFGTRVRPVLRGADVWIPSVVALVTAVLASAWPAWQAARLRPAEALRRT